MARAIPNVDGDTIPQYKNPDRKLQNLSFQLTKQVMSFSQEEEEHLEKVTPKILM